MTPVFICGAECRAAFVATGGTVEQHVGNSVGAVVETTIVDPQGGSASWKLTGASQYLTPPTASGSTTVLKMRFYVTSASSTFGLLYAAVDDGNVFTVYVVAGQLRVSADSSLGNWVPGGAVSANAWHTLDVKMEALGSNNQITTKLDLGASVTTSQATLASSSVDSVYFGDAAGTVTTGGAVLYIDNTVMSKTAADFPIGDSKVIGYTVGVTSGTHVQTAGDLKNNSAVNITSGDSSGGLVDDIPAVLTDYVAQTVLRTTSYWEGIYATSAETGTPRGVQQIAFVGMASAASGTHKTQLYDGTSAADAYPTTSFQHTTAAALTKCWSAPPSGGAWTNAKFKLLRIRWGFSGDVTPNPRLFATVIEAEFAIVAAPVKTYAATLTGGGVVVATRLKQAIRTQALTGGGVIARTSLKQGLRTQALTGGGVVVAAPVAQRLRTQVMTGGGVVVPVQSSVRYRTQALTGGGVLVYTYTRSAVSETHTGTAVLTGGGVIARTSLKQGLRVQAMTGGGVVVVLPAATRLRTQAMTGGGVVVTSQTSVRYRTQAATGGGVAVYVARRGGLFAATATGSGVVTRTSLKQGLAVAAPTGGGVVVALRVANRTRTQIMSGGGVAVVTQTSVRTRTQALSGGGVAVLARTSARTRTQVLSGGGVVVSLYVRPVQRTVVMTGGGVVVPAAKSTRVRTQALSGGGVVTYTYATGSLRTAFVVMTGGGVAVIARKGVHQATSSPTGGGVVAYTYQRREQRYGTAVLSGAGVAVVTRTSARVRAQALSGGGVITRTSLHGATSTVAGTGGGIIARVVLTNRRAAAVATGGGVIAFTATAVVTPTGTGARSYAIII